MNECRIAIDDCWVEPLDEQDPAKLRVCAHGLDREVYRYHATRFADRAEAERFAGYIRQCTERGRRWYSPPGINPAFWSPLPPDRPAPDARFELLALGYYGRLPWQHPRYRSDR